MSKGLLHCSVQIRWTQSITDWIFRRARLKFCRKQAAREVKPGKWWPTSVHEPWVAMDAAEAIDSKTCYQGRTRCIIGAMTK